MGIAAAVLAMSAFFLLTALPVSTGLGSTLSSVNETISTASSSACNPVASPSPSALYIPLGEPKVNLSAGGTLTSEYEVQVVNYSVADLGMPLYFPTVFFTFPTHGGPNFSLTLTPTTYNITGAGWSNPALTSHSAVVPGGLAFTAGVKARLSTQRLAIMAPVNYGAITIEVRWKWTLQQANGTTTAAPWSVPTNASHGPSNLPSIFEPAPYVTFLAGAGNGAPVTIGTNYTATIGRDVAGRYFFLEMEDGAGHVVMDQGQTAPANATTFDVSIPVINYDSYLPPEKYLVHIHDSCGAILYNKLISAVFAPQANITFTAQPCGSITFNGTSFSNNTVGVFTPSTTPYTFSVHGCKGHSFNSWVTTGALHIEGSTKMLVSGSGTFAVKYN